VLSVVFDTGSCSRSVEAKLRMLRGGLAASLDFAAAVRHGPAYGSSVAAIDDAKAKTMPGCPGSALMRQN
jgi:hypothetical protein